MRIIKRIYYSVIIYIKQVKISHLRNKLATMESEKKEIVNCYISDDTKNNITKQIDLHIIDVQNNIQKEENQFTKLIINKINVDFKK